MKRDSLISTIVVASLSSMLFIGCGESSGSSGSTAATDGVLVDPYIVGSVLCEDKNKNGTCDTGEQVSTVTTATGEFSFSEALTAGSHIIIKTQGKHEGVTYDLNISGVVDANGTINVVSPLTTFETKGLTTTQIANILNEAAINENLKLSDGTNWRITADKISSNPLANNLLDTKVGDLNESDLVTIQASLTTYGILKIMKGSSTLDDLNASALYDSGMNENGHSEVHEITKGLLKNITSTLNKTLLENIKNTIDTGRSQMAIGLKNHPSYNTDAKANEKAINSMPEPTIEIAIKVAVSIIDKLAQIGYETCNETAGTDAQKVTQALAAVSTKAANLSNQAMDLGQQLYGLTYQTQLSQLEDVGFGYNFVQYLPSHIQTGINAKKNGKETIRFDASDGLEAK